MGKRGFDESSTGSTSSRRAFLSSTVGVGGLAVSLGIGQVRDRDEASQSSDGIPTPWLHTDGNLIQTPEGNEVILRGVCTADPKRLGGDSSHGKNITEVIDLATDAGEGWYSRVIHIPVQPGDVGGHPPGSFPDPVAFSENELQSYLENHLDPAVERCKERGTYCIVDYHRHRYENYTDSELDREVRMFWEMVAPRYADQSHVLFELYNEPVRPFDFQGDTEKYWSTWKSTAQPWVDVIRKHAPRNLVLVGSPNWSTFPQGATLYEEFDGENLAYTLTVYPGHWPETEEQYDEWIGRAWEEIPLFVTEWGYQPNADFDHISGTTEGFGKTMESWFSDRPIHWAVWCFDPEWTPVMFEQSSGRPGEWNLLDGTYQGQFTKDLLAEHKNDGVPSGDS